MQMALGPSVNTALTDDQVREFFSVSESLIVALLGTESHHLVRLRRKPNKADKPVNPAQPLLIIRNSFGTPVEVYNK